MGHVTESEKRSRKNPDDPELNRQGIKNCVHCGKKKCIVKFWMIGPEKNKASGPDYFLSVLFVTWPLLGKIYISPAHKNRKKKG